MVHKKKLQHLSDYADVGHACRERPLAKLQESVHNIIASTENRHNEECAEDAEVNYATVEATNDMNDN